MALEGKSGNSGSRTTIMLAIFFGMGFASGFLTCFGYMRSQENVKVVEVFRDAPLTVIGSADFRSADSTVAAAVSLSPDLMNYMISADEEISIQNIDLVLSEHALDEDENGLFIYGVIVNQSAHAFDAVRIAFDLCNAQGAAYSSVTDTAMERMEPGDSWGFTIYIPYTEMDQFSSYRLQSIMGVTN